MTSKRLYSFAKRSCFSISLFTGIGCQPLTEFMDYITKVRRKNIQRQSLEKSISDKQDSLMKKSPFSRIYNPNEPNSKDSENQSKRLGHIRQVSEILETPAPEISSPSENILLTPADPDSQNNRPVSLHIPSDFAALGFDKQGPFFWIAEKNGKKLYILGTTRARINYEDLKCSQAISKYIDKSSLTFFEIHPENNQALFSLVKEVLKDMAMDTNFKNFQRQTREDVTLADALQNTDFSNLNPETQILLQQKLLETIHQQAHRDNINQEFNQKMIKQWLSRKSYWGIFHLLEEMCIKEASSEPIAAFSETELAEIQEQGFSLYLEKIFEKIIEEDINKIQQTLLPQTPESILDDQISAKIKSYKTALDYLEQPEDQLDAMLATMGFTRNQPHLVTKQHIEDFITNYNTLCSKEKMEIDINISSRMDTSYLSGDKETRTATHSQSLTASIELAQQYGFLNEIMADDIKNTVIFDMNSRNERWLQKLIMAHNTAEKNHTDIFVIGGAEHFIGDFNILDRLKDRDYVIKHLNFNCQEEQISGLLSALKTK